VRVQTPRIGQGACEGLAPCKSYTDEACGFESRPCPGCTESYQVGSQSRLNRLFRHAGGIGSTRSTPSTNQPQYDRPSQQPRDGGIPYPSPCCGTDTLFVERRGEHDMRECRCGKRSEV
jgi:hypothetical protein